MTEGDGAGASTSARIDSLAERIAARATAQSGVPAAPPRRRSVVPWVLAASLLIFLLGLLASPWLERTVRAQLPGFAAADPTRALEERLSAQEARIGAIEARVTALEADARSRAAPATPSPLARPLTDVPSAPQPTDGRLEQRVDALEEGQVRQDERLSAVEVAVGTASASASDARGALLLGGVRRAVEAGRPLGTLEAPLRARFAPRYPAATEAVAALANAGITLPVLRARLASLRPALLAEAEPAPAGWWERLRATLADLFVVRRAGTAPTAEARVTAAEARLAAGDVVGAIRQLEPLPAAAPWLAPARLWVAGQAGLSTLEAAATEAAVPSDLLPAGPPAAIAPSTPAPAV